MYQGSTFYGNFAASLPFFNVKLTAIKTSKIYIVRAQQKSGFASYLALNIGHKKVSSGSGNLFQPGHKIGVLG